MRYLFFLLFLAGCAATRSQSALRTVDFFLDPVGKFYYLRSDDRLLTDNPLGQNQFEFYDSSLGAPDLVDVTNPFAILLYYEAYGQIIILDRTLSEISRLDLFGLEGILEPSAVARAADNRVWVFDGWDYRLKLLDAQGEISRQSNDLRLELQLDISPDRIYVDKASVILHFMGQQRLAVFTNYGRFTAWVDLPAARNFGWHAPFLVGIGADRAVWRWQEGARPQVQSLSTGQDAITPVPTKMIPVREGVYYLDYNGLPTLLQAKGIRKN